MLRLVLDTNVVLDLFHFADPAARPILAAIEAGSACCLVDAAGLEELARVVTYPEFGLSPAAGAALVERYRRLATPADSTGALRALPRCRDPDDQKFLELAARADADLLISKDKALLKLRRKSGLGFRILGPTAAGELFNSKP